MENNSQLRLKLSEDEPGVGYLYIKNSRNNINIPIKQVRLRDYLDYEGPDILIDLSEQNILLGIEILE